MSLNDFILWFFQNVSNINWYFWNYGNLLSKKYVTDYYRWTMDWTCMWSWQLTNVCWAVCSTLLSFNVSIIIRSAWELNPFVRRSKTIGPTMLSCFTSYFTEIRSKPFGPYWELEKNFNFFCEHNEHSHMLWAACIQVFRCSLKQTNRLLFSIWFQHTTKIATIWVSNDRTVVSTTAAMKWDYLWSPLLPLPLMRIIIIHR